MLIIRRPTGIPSSHLHRLIIPDDVLIQFDLPMMSAVTLETCGDVKQIHEKVCQVGYYQELVAHTLTFLSH